jgi:hypothetical protein
LFAQCQATIAEHEQEEEALRGQVAFRSIPALLK